MWTPGPWSVRLAWVILTLTKISYTLRYPATREISVLRPEDGQGIGELVASLRYMCPI